MEEQEPKDVTTLTEEEQAEVQALLEMEGACTIEGRCAND